MINFHVLHLKARKMKIVEFANNIDPDEAAHNELPHLDLHSLPYLNSQYYRACSFSFVFFFFSFLFQHF